MVIKLKSYQRDITSEDFSSQALIGYPDAYKEVTKGASGQVVKVEHWDTDQKTLKLLTVALNLDVNGTLQSTLKTNHRTGDTRLATMDYTNPLLTKITVT